MAYYDPENPQDNPNDNPGQPPPGNQDAPAPAPDFQGPKIDNGAVATPTNDGGAQAGRIPQSRQQDFVNQAKAQGISDQYISSFLAANPGDYNRLASSYDSGKTGSGPDTNAPSSGSGFNYVDKTTGQWTSMPRPGVSGGSAPTFAMPPAGGANTFRPSGVPNNPNTSPQFTDPAQRLVESNALNRMQQLNNPDPNSGTALFEQYAKQLVDQLKSPAYSQGDEATIIAAAMDHISQEEATTQQQWLEEMGRRNINPSSGIALQGLQNIKNQFEQARASVHQQFATQAIGQTQANRTQALGVLGNLATSENTRLNAAQNFAEIPYNMGNTAFDQSMQAVQAGGSPQANAQTAISLMTAVQNSQTLSSQQKAAAAQAIMAFIAGL